MCEWFLVVDKEYDGSFSIYNFYGTENGFHNVHICDFTYEGSEIIRIEERDETVNALPDIKKSSITNQYPEIIVEQFDPFDKNHPGLEFLPLDSLCVDWFDFIYPGRGDIYRYWEECV